MAQNDHIAVHGTKQETFKRWQVHIAKTEIFKFCVDERSVWEQYERMQKSLDVNNCNDLCA